MDSAYPILRILQVNATRPGTVGGLQAVVETLTKGLRKRGHSVTQIDLGDRFEQRTPNLWEIQLAAPTTRHRIPTIGSLLRMIHSAAKLCMLLWTVRPGVVHFNYATWETVYFVVLRPIFRYRLVVTVHGSDLLHTRWPLARAVLPYVLRQADTVTAVSEDLVTRTMEIQGGRGPKPILICNGVDASFWTPDKTSSPARHSIVTVGRLEPVKGHDVLLAAFATVRRSIPEAHLTVIGDGTQRPSLTEQANRLGLRSAVTFTGTLGPLEIRQHLRRATVFVLPSRTEGLPVALLEALATGTPAVASNVGGIPNVLAAGGGFVVPSEDPRALADKIVLLLADAGLAQRTGQAALARARDYAPSRVLDTYERVLRGQIPAPEDAISPTMPPSRTSQHRNMRSAYRSLSASSEPG